MRTLPGNLSTEISKTVTTPFYLVKLVFSLGTLTLSSRQTVSYGGSTYTASGIDSINISSDSVTIVLNNSDSSVSALVLNASYREGPATVWATYDGVDVIQIFNGYMSEIPVIAEVVNIKCVTYASGATWLPRIFIGPPLCNFLPAAGSRLGDIILEPGSRI